MKGTREERQRKECRSAEERRGENSAVEEKKVDEGEQKRTDSR